MTEKADLIGRLAILGEEESTQTALFHERAAAHYGLGLTDMKALGILLRNGPQTAGALIDLLQVTSGAVTGVIDRLARAGVAKRVDHPTDRRRVVVTANHDNLARRENIYLGIGDAFEQLYRGYTLEELRFLVRHAERAIAITRAQAGRLTPTQ